MVVGLVSTLLGLWSVGVVAGFVEVDPLRAEIESLALVVAAPAWIGAVLCLVGYVLLVQLQAMGPGRFRQQRRDRPDFGRRVDPPRMEDELLRGAKGKVEGKDLGLVGVIAGADVARS